MDETKEHTVEDEDTYDDVKEGDDDDGDCNFFALPLGAEDAYNEPTKVFSSDLPGIQRRKWATPFEPPQADDVPAEDINEMIKNIPLQINPEVKNFLLNEWPVYYQIFDAREEDKGSIETTSNELWDDYPPPYLLPTHANSYKLQNGGSKLQERVFFKSWHNEKIEKLIQEIYVIDRGEPRLWYKEVRLRLERLLEMKLSNGDNPLHIFLTADLRTFKEIVCLISTLGLYNLLNRTNDKKLTILHFTIIHELPDIVQFLIEKGCDPAIGDVYYNTALHEAVKYSTTSTLKSLLDAMSEKEDENKFKWLLERHNCAIKTALHIAVELGRLECVQLLLRSGAYPLGNLHDGTNPLHTAVVEDRFDIVKELLDHTSPNEMEFALNQSADYHYLPQNVRYMTPLQIACFNPVRENTLEIIKLLMEKGACPQCCRTDYSDPARKLAMKNPEPAVWEIVEHFKDRSIKMNAYQHSLGCRA